MSEKEITVKSFKDLIVWQKSYDLVLFVYKVTEDFPEIEKFGLISQMRRAVVSVSSNIVEGFARKKIKESLHFYNIANASLEELKSQIIISYKVNLLKKEDFYFLSSLSDEVGRVLHAWSLSQSKNYELNNLV